MGECEPQNTLEGERTPILDIRSGDFTLKSVILSDWQDQHQHTWCRCFGAEKTGIIS